MELPLQLYVSQLLPFEFFFEDNQSVKSDNQREKREGKKREQSTTNWLQKKLNNKYFATKLH